MPLLLGKNMSICQRPGGIFAVIAFKDWFPWVTVTFSDGFLEISCLVEVVDLRGAIVNQQQS